jgi:hypothetical protein
MRDHFTKLGVNVVPALRKAVAATEGSDRTELEKQIAAKRVELQAADHRHAKAKLQKELDELLDHARRYNELAELAAVIESLNAKDPSADDVVTLCRFYVKRPWGNQYFFTRSESSYLRALDETQLVLIRKKLIAWGPAALLELKQFLEDDGKVLAALLDQLTADEAHWELQRPRLRGLPLARIAREREDIQAIRAELRDIAALIECAEADKLTAEQIGLLCRLYTRSGWPGQYGLIEGLLKTSGSGAKRVIRKHIQQDNATLSELQPVIEKGMIKPASIATKWRCDRAVALRRNILRGVVGLEALIAETH